MLTATETTFNCHAAGVAGKFIEIARKQIEI
jgi:hypothetical protein